MKVYNHISIDIDCSTLNLLKCVKSLWRQRNILLYQHPVFSDRIISVGTSFDNTYQVIADESKVDWASELSCDSELVIRS